MRAVLLVGGLGTRLRAAVPSLPKALALVGGRPFLELLVRQLANQGIQQLVMCTGYLAEQIENTFGRGADFGVGIEYSRETVPLGTAGALKLAERFLAHDPDFLVLNGDSFLDVNFQNLIRFHRTHDSVATLAVTTVSNASRYGTVQLLEDGRVSAFTEKYGLDVAGTINAGIYVLSQEVLNLIPDGPSSLERDIFPLLLGKGIYGFNGGGTFIDIGTPDDYLKAKEISEALEKAAGCVRTARPLSTKAQCK